MNKRAAFIITLFLTLSSLMGQTQNEILRLALEVAELNSDPMLLEELTESLLILAEDPVRINSATEDELSKLFFLTEFQVKALFEYIRYNGPVGSLYELSYLTGFDRELATMLEPYISLEVRNNLLPLKVYPRQRFMTKLMWRPDSSKSFGDERRIYARYRLDWTNISTGFTLENDAGETSFPVDNNPPDFMSAYVMITGRTIPFRIILGDYSIRAGQGIGINSAFRTGINTLSQSMFIQKNDLRPYTSSGENMFLRGVAGTIEVKNFQLTGFISENKADATLWNNPEDNETSIRSFYTAGYHDSPLNRLKKDAVGIFTGGAGIEWNGGLLRAGLTGALVRFSHPLLPEFSTLEGPTATRGARHDFLSLYFKYNKENILIWGEGTADYSGDIALLAGMRLNPRKGLSVTASCRRYPPGFYTYHGNPVSAFTYASNETGVTAGIGASLIKNITVELGTDLSWRDAPDGSILPLHPKSRTDLRIISDRGEYLRLIFLFQHRENEELLSTDDPGFSSIRQVSNLVSIYPVLHAAPNLTLSARYIIKETSGIKEKGSLFFVESRLLIPEWKTTVWGRFTGYKTDGYESRIYAWENDMVSAFNVSMFSGEGTASYIMAEHEPFPKIYLRIKYSVRNGLVADGSLVRSSYLNLQLRGSF